MKCSSVKMSAALLSIACAFPNIAMAKWEQADVNKFRGDVRVADNDDIVTFDEDDFEQNLKYVNFKVDLDKFYRNYTGSIDHELRYFVPSNVNLVDSQWSGARAIIHGKLGQISPTLNDLPDALDWRNSASTVDDLYNAAVRNVAGFKILFHNVVSQVPGAWVSFGPGDNFAVKSKQSLTDKINRQINNGVKDPVPKIGDALRGTIVVNSASQLTQVVEVLNRTFNHTNIVFSDKFNEPPYASGYVGVHGGLLYQNGTDAIQSEMQVHFSNVMDGGLNCPKEYTHGIYEKTRSLENKPDHEALTAKGNIAQKLVFLFGLDRVLKGIIPVPNLEASVPETSDSPYVYRYDSGMLMRSQPSTFGRSSHPYAAGALPSLEVYNPSTCKWNLIADPEQQLVYYNMLEETGDAVSEMTANNIQNKMSTFNVRQLNGQNGFIIKTAANELVDVVGLGDVNGDGIEDMGLSGKKGIHDQTYVVYGRSNQFSPVIMPDQMSAKDGFSIVDDIYNVFSTAVGHIGDINNDGLADIGAVASYRTGQGSQLRFSYAYLGSKDQSQNVKYTSALNGQNGFVATDADAESGAGINSGIPVDFNGDGIQDLVIGGQTAHGGGWVYVVYGTKSGFPKNINLANLDGHNGVLINGHIGHSCSYFGDHIASLGDINGDGIGDIAISDSGAPYSGNVCNHNAGAVYVVFGNRNFSNGFSIANLNGSNGFTITSAYADNVYTGSSISGGGDINGDGINDIVVNAASAGGGKGEAYVVYGTHSGYPANLSLSSLNGQNGFTVSGVKAGDQVGVSVSFIGDFNADGIDDLFIGAPGATYGGAGYILYGSAKPFSARMTIAQINQCIGMSVTSGDTWGGIGNNAGFGDFNHDGVSDLIVGLGGTNAAVVFGSR